MALSLDDLKKKKKPISAGPAVAPGVSTVNSGFTARKKLSPWDSISELSSEPSNNKSIVSELSHQELPLKVESEIVVALPAIKDSSIVEVSKIALDAQTCPLSSPSVDQYPSTLFSELGDTNSLNFRSDTEVTQIRHRSDTESVPILPLKNTDITIIQTLVPEEKGHRSDTNNKSSADILTLSSDTEVTQDLGPNKIKRTLDYKSDTEVTQTSNHLVGAKTFRSDTEVTQIRDHQNKGLLAKQKKAVLYQNEVPSNRSDTEVTHSINTKEVVSHLPLQVTQIPVGSDTEVTPYKTQKRHKDLTQVSAVLDAELTAKKLLLLKGNQLSVFNYCCFTLLNLGENTLKVAYESLASQTTVNIGSIKTTLKRLRESNLISIESHGGGKGAFIYIRIEDSVLKIYARSMGSRSDTEVTHFMDKKGHRSDTIPDTKAPSKLVSIINNNLLTNNPTEDLDSKFLTEPKLDVASINLSQVIKHGVTRKQIQDIFNQKLEFTTHTLQDFVDRFAVYAGDAKNIRGINSIPAVFVKMAQLASKGQDPLLDVETDTDRLIRERIERLKAMQEERLKQESELVTLEFENWYSCQSLKQMDDAAPPSQAFKSGSSMQKIILKSYFIENVWNEKKALLYGSNTNVPIDLSNLLE